jgi:hypothetical protein
MMDSKWLPIETAPKDGRMVLLWFPGIGGNCRGPAVGWWDGVWTTWDDGAQGSATHWVAIPTDPPETAQ